MLEFTTKLNVNKESADWKPGLKIKIELNTNLQFS